MAVAPCAGKFLAASCFKSRLLPRRTLPLVNRSQRRSLKTASQLHTKPADFAFAFDIDGVLLRSAQPLPGASRALKYLQGHGIPFIVLTNGGGKHEKERVDELSQRLKIPLDTGIFIQSHTPFVELVNTGGKGHAPLKDGCVLVIGGDKDKCRHVAKSYGFENVLIPSDLIASFPALMPFSSPSNHKSHAQDLSHKTISSRNDNIFPPSAIKVDAILVFNDPRDWALDAQIILDLLLSKDGYLGTISPKNNMSSLPNRGFQQDGQPPLYFSNPDLLWAAEYHLPRLGQGGFREAFEGIWEAVTGGPSKGVKLEMQVFGKPFQTTYEFAEKRLQKERNMMMDLPAKGTLDSRLKKVYMIGDNPESDILGANQYKSPTGSQWSSILVRTGVYPGGEPVHKPTVIVEDVWEAVEWALKDSDWKEAQI